jgi:branched-chain amino acid transport system ATP-binding protein
MSETLLSVRALTRSFAAVYANRDFNLDLREHEIHALIGPNGAGKTTALSQLAGEIRPDSGSIRLRGRDITDLPIQRRVALGVSRSFQISSVFEELTTRQNVALAVQAHASHSFRFWRPAMSDPRIAEPSNRLLERFGLTAEADIRAGTLSHGEKRQLEVAMALAGKPLLLLLDEPMAGIGPGGTRKLQEVFEGLKGEVTILLVEHDMDVVFSLADRITVLVYGRNIATGTPEQIRANPQVRHAYLGADP